MEKSGIKWRKGQRLVELLQLSFSQVSQPASVKNECHRPQREVGEVLCLWVHTIIVSMQKEG